MNRHSRMPGPSKPMPKMSAKKLAALGGYATSTFDKPGPQLKTSAMKQKRPMPAVPVDVREALKVRAGEGEWCEAQLPGVCAGRAIDPHHRIKQQSGGRHGEAKKEADRLSNVVYLCRPCHSWAHWKPFSATNPMGLILRQSDNPMQVPVLYRGEPMYLTDGGRVVSFEKAGA